MLDWFCQHTPLVLSRDGAFRPTIGLVVRSVPEAIQAATSASVPEIYVCGGSAAYTLAMPHATRLLITHVETRLGSGVAFPVISADWQVISEHIHRADVENVHAMRFVEYRRLSEHLET
jgi:dihydrofolate reductase